MNEKKPWIKFLFGGLLPILAFTWVEDQYGLLWGVVAGMAFSAGEIIFEFIQEKKVSLLTIGTGSAIFVLGGISLLSQEGIWFKLQPALFEGIFAIVIFVFSIRKKPILIWMMEQQKKSPPEFLRRHFAGISLRMGFFFLIHCGIATWAAIAWETKNWALLKGVGFTGSLLVYLGIEILLMRRAAAGRLKS
jgi:intracellular septation protein